MSVNTLTSVAVSPSAEAANVFDGPEGRRWLLIGAGLVVFHFSLLGPGSVHNVWLPAAGLGLALIAWTGWLALIPLAVDYLAVRLLLEDSAAIAVSDALLLAGQLGLSWWCYHQLALGTRRLEDPRSATLFLILIPGGIALGTALLTAGVWSLFGEARLDYWSQVTILWIARALGILVLTPPLLVAVTPLLVRARLTAAEPRGNQAGGLEPTDWTFGEGLEVCGMLLATGVLGIVLALLQMQGGFSLHLWGFNLLLVVWAALRQGLRGGALAAAASSLLGLATVSFLGANLPEVSPFQGVMLAQCSTALLVGASAGWIRASEARYRQVVGHIPVMLYSVRLPRGRTVETRKGDVGAAVLNDAEVTLVSAASRIILSREPEDLYGPFAAWVARIEPADRELVVAALGQLCRQKQPVTCEYRLVSPHAPGEHGSPLRPILSQHLPRLSRERWLRDTLVPNHDTDGNLAGWEGVIEDITEQRGLAHDLRLASGIFHALIASMPTGVFFVQGPGGQVLLINARARKLLGQREDLAASLEHMSQVYRLFRPDGSEYPWEELPVTRALRDGKISLAGDIVVHRPDGRRVALVSWAAPVSLTGMGQPDAAVWILEDLNATLEARNADAGALVGKRKRERAT